MNQWRKILTPFSWLYNGVTKTRNVLYDRKLLPSNTFATPLIVVGNLRIGGTGKTPMVDYLIHILKSNYKIATLSRGYKRKSKGFVLADNLSNAASIGDEPYQLWRKHPDIIVAVDADRTHGIHQLEALDNPPDLILLDDAFQHRKISAGFNILLTPYDDLYVDDQILPAGNLREHISGSERAQIIVVTKCPEVLSQEQEFEIAAKLQPTLNQTVFFSRIQYAPAIKNESQSIASSELHAYQILLVTGIANPKSLLLHLATLPCEVTHLSYPDHHHFTESDLNHIQQVFEKMPSNNKLILTTEKDYVRIFENLSKIYYLAIETVFINHQKDFDTLIVNYVEQSSRNR